MEFDFYSFKFVKGVNLFIGSGIGYYYGFNISLCVEEKIKVFC